MAIVSVTETLAETPRSGSINERYERTYTRVWQVKTDSRYDAAYVTMNAVGIPRIGDVYAPAAPEIDLGAVVKEVTARQRDQSGLLWEVQARYSSAIDNGPVDPNPLLRPADISGDLAEHKQPQEKDIDGKSILTSADEPFNTPAEIDDSRPVLLIEKNFPTWNPRTQLLYKDKLNSDYFFGFAPGELKVAGIRYKREWENNVFFWRVQAEFHGRELIPAQGIGLVSGWHHLPLDAGFHEIKNGRKVPIRENGHPLNSPVPLDGYGRRLQPGQEKTYLLYRAYYSIPFAPLGLL